MRLDVEITRTQLRIENLLLEKVKAFALANKRSINNAICVLVARAIKAEEAALARDFEDGNY